MNSKIWKKRNMKIILSILIMNVNSHNKANSKFFQNTPRVIPSGVRGERTSSTPEGFGRHSGTSSPTCEAAYAPACQFFFIFIGISISPQDYKVFFSLALLYSIYQPMAHTNWNVFSPCWWLPALAMVELALTAADSQTVPNRKGRNTQDKSKSTFHSRLKRWHATMKNRTHLNTFKQEIPNVITGQYSQMVSINLT